MTVEPRTTFIETPGVACAIASKTEYGWLSSASWSTDLDIDLASARSIWASLALSMLFAAKKLPIMPNAPVRKSTESTRDLIDLTPFFIVIFPDYGSRR